MLSTQQQPIGHIFIAMGISQALSVKQTAYKQYTALLCVHSHAVAGSLESHICHQAPVSHSIATAYMITKLTQSTLSTILNLWY